MSAIDTHTLQIFAIGAVMVGACEVAAAFIAELEVRKPYMAQLLRRKLGSVT